MTDDNRLAALVQELSAKLATANKALEKIAAGNPGTPKWLTDVEMANIARAALRETTG